MKKNAFTKPLIICNEQCMLKKNLRLLVAKSAFFASI